MEIWIPRELESYIKEAASTRPVIALTGARQTGKTSLFRHLFPDYNYVSLDLPSEAEAAEMDSSSFLARHGERLIIDEVQYAPGLFRHLKMAVDKKRNLPGQYLLTGSQKFSFIKEIADSLAGRIEIIELETLSSHEIFSAKAPTDIDSVVLRGGFPELHANPNINSVTYYRSYISTYLERDVRQLLNVANLRDFERFIRACALRSAQLLNKAELARDVGIHPTTANDWLSVLQASNQVVLLEPWFTNFTKTLTKTPKLYMADTGLLCTLLNITTQDELQASPLRGAVWETFVFGELRKRQIADKGYWSMNFWRDRTAEVDFVIDRGGRFDLIEAKWSEAPDKGSCAGFSAFASKQREKTINSKSIICRTPNTYPLSSDTMVRNVNDLAYSQ